MYCVFAVKPLSVYDGLVCHPLSVAPGPKVVSLKKYSTGPVASEPVVAVMLIAEELSADGAEANVAGFGVGAVVSGAASVVPCTTKPMSRLPFVAIGRSGKDPAAYDVRIDFPVE